MFACPVTRPRLLTLVFFVSILCFSSPAVAIGQTLISSDVAGDPLVGRDFVELNGSVFFSATSFTHLGSLWKTDGSATGTAPVFSTPPTDSSIPLDLTSDGNVLAFLAESEDEQTYDLWTSDGSTAGTVKHVIDVSVNDGRTYEIARSIVIVNGRVLGYSRPWVFSLDPSSGDSTNLFRADNDVTFVKAGSDFAYAFATTFDVATNGLIRTDGTRQGTLLLESGIVPKGEEYIGIVGERLVMIANSFTGLGNEIFISDGTVEGSEYLPEQLVGDDDIHCSPLSSDGQFVYMGIRSPDLTNCKPFRSDGTAEGTGPVADFTGLQLKFFGATDDYVFFAEGIGSYWRTDGTTEGTIKLGDFGYAFSPVIAFNGKGYFVALDAVSGGTRLFETDGSVEGTVAIFSTPEDAIGPITGLQVLGGRLYFSAYTTFYIDGTPTNVEDPIQPVPFSLNVFPNPASDYINIQRVDPISNIVTDPASILTLYNVLGQQVLQREVYGLDETYRLDVSTLAPGPYFLRLQTSETSVSTAIIRSE